MQSLSPASFWCPRPSKRKEHCGARLADACREAAKDSLGHLANNPRAAAARLHSRQAGIGTAIAKCRHRKISICANSFHLGCSMTKVKHGAQVLES